MNKKLKKII